MDRQMLIHPGEVLKEEFLAPYGLNANRLATRLGVPANAVTTIINGDRGISGAMSKLLGRAFNVSEEFFANLQTRYELDLATLDAQSGGKTAERLRRADAFARELAATD